MTLDIDVVRPASLDVNDVDAWKALREASGARGPFSSPDWYRALSAVRPETRVCVGQRAGELVLVWPMDVTGRLAVPAGATLTDVQRFVAVASLGMPPGRVLRLAGIQSWRFDHADSAVRALWPNVTMWRPSYVVDTRARAHEGAVVPGSGRASLSKWVRGQRRILEREWGPLAFEMHTDDPAGLSLLAEWKSAQYRRTGAADVFGETWTRDLFDVLLDDAPGFGLHVSVLRAGDRIAAVHAGPIADGVWHWWLPAYDPAMAKGSPGALLLWEAVQAASDAAVDLLDLGPGDETYKRRFATRTRPVGRGVVHASGSRTTARRLVASVTRTPRAVRRRLIGVDGAGLSRT